MECGKKLVSTASLKLTNTFRYMNCSLRSFTPVVPMAGALFAASTIVHGADVSTNSVPSTNTPPVRIDLDDEVDHTGWFVRLGARASSGLKVSLQDRKASPSIVPGQYDNGFVHPDISGSSATTWNWGYSSASQVQGGNIVMTDRRAHV